MEDTDPQLIMLFLRLSQLQALEDLEKNSGIDILAASDHYKYLLHDLMQSMEDMTPTPSHTVLTTAPLKAPQNKTARIKAPNSMEAIPFNTELPSEVNVFGYGVPMSFDYQNSQHQNF